MGPVAIPVFETQNRAVSKRRIIYQNEFPISSIPVWSRVSKHRIKTRFLFNMAVGPYQNTVSQMCFGEADVMKEAAWYHAGLLFAMPEQGIFKNASPLVYCSTRSSSRTTRRAHGRTPVGAAFDAAASLARAQGHALS